MKEKFTFSSEIFLDFVLEIFLKQFFLIDTKISFLWNLSIGHILLNINKYFLSIVIIFNYFLVLNYSYSEEIEIINPITVTGYHYPKKLTETGSAVTVINNEEIEQSGMQYVSQVLSATAGFQAYKSGGPQSLTRAFDRTCSSFFRYKEIFP